MLLNNRDDNSRSCVEASNISLLIEIIDEMKADQTNTNNQQWYTLVRPITYDAVDLLILVSRLFFKN